MDVNKIRTSLSEDRCKNTIFYAFEFPKNVQFITEKAEQIKLRGITILRCVQYTATNIFRSAGYRSQAIGFSFQKQRAQ